MKHDATDRFIEAWGAMGVLWGINRSMARVHALLMISEDPMDLDAVATSLGISRGNASMCLRDLRHWGVIHRVHLHGDRHDYFVAEQDSWKMFFRIASERKKREFDPAIRALSELLAETDPKTRGRSAERLTQMKTILGTADRLLRRFLKDEDASRHMVSFLSKTLLD